MDKSAKQAGPRGGPRQKESDMTNTKASQGMVEAHELTDDELEMITGGKGRGGRGGSIVHDIVGFFKWLIEKHGNNNS